MHGLINRSIQCFLNDSFGPAVWADVAERAALPLAGFEAMLTYDDKVTMRMLGAACARLDRPQSVLLEDLGTYLVSCPQIGWLRRLLRFGGVTFVDFLHSLDQLPDRGRLAVPDLDLPLLDLDEVTPGRFVLTCHHEHGGYGHVLVGVLRTMADDYGALVLLDHHDGAKGEMITITVAEARFAEGRRFELAVG